MTALSDYGWNKKRHYEVADAKRHAANLLRAYQNFSSNKPLSEQKTTLIRRDDSHIGPTVPDKTQPLLRKPTGKRFGEANGRFLKLVTRGE